MKCHNYIYIYNLTIKLVKFYIYYCIVIEKMLKKYSTFYLKQTKAELNKTHNCHMTLTARDYQHDKLNLHFRAPDVLIEI